MSEFKIEKGVPIPKGRRHADFLTALKALEVGDSVDVGDGLPISSRRATAHNLSIRLGRKFSWRKSRVWRVA